MVRREAVTDKVFSVFAKSLMHDEIAKAIPYAIDEKIKTDFANKVFERFCNPFIDHQWLSITVQYTSKMKMRNVPLILRHYEQTGTAPIHMATGFAAFLLYMKAIRKKEEKYFGERNSAEYEIKDDSAEYFYTAWQQFTPQQLVKEILQDVNLWEIDLSALPGFCSTVQEQLNSIMSKGALTTIEQLISKKELV
jgi:tagaturonate reductase